VASGHIKNRTLFAYGLADMPIMLATMPMLLYLNKFYATDVGIDLIDLANIMLFARLFDLVTDPLVGYLSDHTRTRWGRRRPWMIASLPFLMMGVYKIFLPPEGVGIWYVFTWLMVLWLGWTMLIIPYYAWGAELSPDYDERTRITGWRAAMGAFGSLVSITIPAIAVIWFELQGIAGIMKLTGIAVLIVIPIAVLITVSTVKENTKFTAPSLPVMAGLKIMFNNGTFRWLVIAFMITNVGVAVLMPLNAFYITGVLEEPEASIPLLLFFTFLAGFLSVPLWVWISKLVGKHRAWIGGFLVVTSISPVYLFLGPGDFWLMAPFVIVSAIGTGSFVALPNSMKADVIDIDAARTGENRAAIYFSAWSLVIKFANTAGSWLGLWALSLVGYNAKVMSENTPESIQGLQYVYAFLPSAIFILAAIVVWNYPLTRARQARIRAAIDRREERRRVLAGAAAE
jgi:glycoside/pentoside/hexuronide:cation symporter, GPH family